MNRKYIVIAIVSLCFNLGKLQSSTKVYLVPGYASIGIEMLNIQKIIEKNGFKTEIFLYNSLKNDIESVSYDFFHKIQNDKNDTILFVTHSMGALLVRSVYELVYLLDSHPLFYRIVMIAPPNNGSYIADMFAKLDFLRFITGPNIENLTTHPLTGAQKYPIPICEIGVIAGIKGSKTGYNIFLKGDNDGILCPEQTLTGIEKDTVFVKSSHIGLLFNNTVCTHVIHFLNTGRFE